MGPSNSDSDRNDFLNSICTNLMRYNACLDKIKPVDKDFVKSPDDVTNALFLQYAMLNEMKTVQHTSIIEPARTSLDSKHFELSQTGYAYITHITDELLGYCNIIDVDSMPKLKYFFTVDQPPMTSLPNPGEMFGYLYQGKFMVRAIRTDKYDPRPTINGYRAYLIDVGCSIQIDIANSLSHHFMLSGEIQDVPGLAKKCQLLNLPESLNVFDLLHTRIQYEVLSNYGQSILINVLNVKNGEQMYEEPNFYTYFLSDAPKLMIENKNSEKNTPITSKESISCTTKLSPRTLNLLKRRNLAKALFSLPTEDCLSQPTPTSTPTPERELKTSNGIVHNESERKGQKSEVEVEVELIETERYLRSLRRIQNKVLESIRPSDQPKIGETFAIQPTHVISATDFYGIRINNSELNELNAHLKSIDVEKELVPHAKLVKIGDKVLATYEKELSRAIVTTFYDENNVQIHFYDYGNCAKVNILELYGNISKLNKYPPFALRFRINGIKTCRFHDLKAIMFLNYLLLPANIRATVIDSTTSELGEHVSVGSFTDENGLDVATTIIRKNYSPRKKVPSKDKLF